MGKKFKKIMAVVGSTFMVGATIGMAVAAGGAFPSPFVKDNSADYAIVYGVGAAASDGAGSNSLNTYLNTFYSVSSDTTSSTGSSTTTTSDFSSSVSISDEIELGQKDIITESKLRAKLEDNKISTLLDTTIDWDNGDGTEGYDIHEEILLTNENGDCKLKLMTNLEHPDGEDLISDVVLQNDASLRYRLVFDDILSFTDKTDAKDLRVSILGKEYDITDFEDDFSGVTISLSEEKVVKKGTVLNIDGVTLTIGEIFSNSIEVNGIFINKDSIKKVNGLEVKVTDVASHTDDSLSKAIIKVGQDIKRDIDDGDEYVKGEEAWEWDIGVNIDGKQYIGVKYVLRNVNYDEDEPEENPISSGESYVFPENYAAVSFDGLTNVSYQDFDLSFDDKDLYNESGKIGNDIDVAIFEGEEDDSITLMYGSNEVETNSLYFNYTENGVEVYFKDIDGDVDSNKKGRIQFNKMYSFVTGNMIGDIPIPLEDVNIHPIEETVGYKYWVGGEVLDAVDAFPVYNEGNIIGYTYEGLIKGEPENKAYNIANLTVKDTEIYLGLNLTKNKDVYLTLTNNGEVTKIPLGVDDDFNFKHIGVKEGNADSGDIIVYEKPVGTKDYDIMDHYGTIIRNPESNADNDRVILSIPDEQVFADISVKGEGTVVTTTETVDGNETEVIVVPQLGGIVLKDTEIESVKDKNLILVGGSCINAETAKLLGGKTCGSEFTLKTGILANQALIQTFASQYDANKVAIVVAGYEAADTTRAVNKIINDGTLDLSVGQKHIV